MKNHETREECHGLDPWIVTGLATGEECHGLDPWIVTGTI